MQTCEHPSARPSPNSTAHTWLTITRTHLSSSSPHVCEVNANSSQLAFVFLCAFPLSTYSASFYGGWSRHHRLGSHLNETLALAFGSRARLSRDNQWSRSVRGNPMLDGCDAVQRIPAQASSSDHMTASCHHAKSLFTNVLECGIPTSSVLHLPTRLSITAFDYVQFPYESLEDLPTLLLRLRLLHTTRESPRFYWKELLVLAAFNSCVAKKSSV
ncbi:MAG: hypothetical protein SGPRY_002098 [Prymnesium sp.]